MAASAGAGAGGVVFILTVGRNSLCSAALLQDEDHRIIHDVHETFLQIV